MGLVRQPWKVIEDQPSALSTPATLRGARSRSLPSVHESVDLASDEA